MNEIDVLAQYLAEKYGYTWEGLRPGGQDRWRKEAQELIDFINEHPELDTFWLKE